jgi:hypothetical protein
MHILPVNGLIFLLNVILYAAHFRFARRSNRRLAALTRQVRSEMGHGLVELPAARRG